MKKTNSTATIETTLGTLVSAEAALYRIGDQDGLSAKTKYHVVKLARLVAAEVQYFTTEQLVILTALGLQQGQAISSVDPRVWAEYQRRMLPVAAVAVTLAWGPVRSTDLPNAKASDLMQLGPLCDLVEPV